MFFFFTKISYDVSLCSLDVENLGFGIVFIAATKLNRQVRVDSDKTCILFYLRMHNSKSCYNH